MKKIVFSLFTVAVMVLLLIGCQSETKTPNGSLSNTTWTRSDDNYPSMTEVLNFDEMLLHCSLIIPGLASTDSNFITFVDGSKLYLNNFGGSTPSASSYDSVYTFSVKDSEITLTYAGGAKNTDLEGQYTKK